MGRMLELVDSKRAVAAKWANWRQLAGNGPIPEKRQTGNNNSNQEPPSYFSLFTQLMCGCNDRNREQAKGEPEAPKHTKTLQISGASGGPLNLEPPKSESDPKRLAGSDLNGRSEEASGSNVDMPREAAAIDDMQ